MTAHPGDQEARAATGASRRDVLRGGAVGMGALVGTLALINAHEVAAEARTGTGRKLNVGFAGINLNNPTPLQSFELGGDVVNAGADPAQTVLTLDSSKYSPELLQAYAEATNLSKIVIKGFERNVVGVEALVLTVTLTAARIISFHTNVVTQNPGHVRDNLLVTWGSLTLLRNDSNKTYTWTLPT